jgi:TonB-linked SusC/RagA family outer membrane protein
MKKHRIMLMTAALLASQAMWAQQKNLSGTVVDSQGEPIIGATVKVPGSATGAITDLDGHFSITVNPGTKLEVSYVGMQTVSLTAGDNMHVILKDDSKTLNDVVVIGYGVQKKSVVTASIAKVDAEDLQGKTQLRAEDALKGLAAGVNVTSASGQPGSKSMIRVRGIGTINNSDPLYIIDGMATDQNGMELVNPEDIESIEVLKDAASGAIYGSRAANGVILVTTKKGVKGNAKINYNFSYGWQNAWRKRDVTGATDYAILQNEKYVNGGQAPLYADPYNLTDVNGNAVTGFGTNWQKELFNDNAPIVQHDLSISGASDKVNYYLSMGYMKQEGIVGGNYGQSNYDRLTLRSNTNYTLFDASKDRKYLNKLDLGVNVGYMRVHNTGIDANSTWGSPLGSALYLSPILPVTITKPDVATAMEKQYSAYELYKDGNGNPYTIPGYFGSYNEQNNPIAMMQGHPTRNWSHKIMPKFSLDLQLFDNLKYHFSYSAELSFWGYDGATTQKFYLSGNNNADHTSATSFKGDGNTWQVDNTLSYDKTIGKHSFGIVLGQSASKYKGSELGGGAWDLINANKPSISYTNGNGQVVYSTDKDGKITGATAHFNVWGAPYTEHRLSSLFARMSYNYDERYMAQFTVRRDGSSRFGSDNLYGTFPSFSLGWNIMNEKFMEPTHNWLSNAKLRFSWGKNGNENIGDFAYTTLTSMGYDYYFGTNSVKTHGSKANRLPNPNLKWEESEQTDIGLDLGFFNSALTFTVDYFVKKTNGMIIAMPIPSYVGENSPLANVGDMKNSGWEFELGYKGHIGDFRYSVRGNASYLHNELTNLGNATGFLDWGISQFSDGGTRAQNGQPFPFFYGYKTAGVFQTVDEVNAYKNADGTLIQPNAIPGDLRFVDVNGDGKITSDDRTNIGNGTPKWTFGLNLNAEYKGFDLNVFFQGVSGVDVFDATYRQDIASGNYPTWMLSRWTGPGTSNRVPRLALGDTKNWVVSDLYVRDGSYLRLKTFQLGYTLPRVLTKRVGVDRFRLFVMAENLITWTKYWGFDPEIGSSTTSLGVDYGVYPQARTWSVGFNITL